MMDNVNRRSFLKRSAALGLAAGAGLPGAADANAKAKARNHAKPARHASKPRDQTRPNILFIVVDQLRHHRWFPDQTQIDTWLPNIARIRKQATSFENHYTASNMCTAARGTLLTGLYSHQTGAMLTLAETSSTLSPLFPTWGTMLREQGYRTAWYGKWHLAAEADAANGTLEPYGFDGGTFPSPNGNPQQGLSMDPVIAGQFTGWLDDLRGNQPWATAVSFVNPHDINWWPNDTNPDQKTADEAVNWNLGAGPPNVETLSQLQARKPHLQAAYYQTLDFVCGPQELYNTGGTSSWDKMLNLYVWYQQHVDAQIGRVLDALYSRPKIAANTIVIFTSDHGEYGGSHGLRAKGGGVYEEGIHVPLYIVDPHRKLSNGTAQMRQQFTSSVDIAPLLLTLAHGSSGWRADPRYEHIAGRHDLAAIAQHPRTPGRPYIAHATDETAMEQASYQYSAFSKAAAHHITSVRTRQGKYAVYSNWADGTTTVQSADQEFELYDYNTWDGVLELDNIAGQSSQLQGQLSDLLENEVIPNELNQKLPAYLQQAHEQGYDDFYSLMSNPANTA
jgi:arylsulfatase A-like enzyme